MRCRRPSSLLANDASFRALNVFATCAVASILRPYPSVRALRTFYQPSFLPPQEIVLKNGSQTFDWWRKPPVHPVMRVYIYNVTNADAFLNNAEKPILNELGPYVYV